MKKVSFDRIYNILVYCLVICVTAAIVIFPKEAVSAASKGVKLCIEVIVPSLFPFLVMSRLTVSLGLAAKAGAVLQPVMNTLFHVPGSCSAAIILGYLGGYPVGAGVVAQLYTDGCCSKSEGEKMLAMCNNSGPAFILGVVGAKVFGSGKIGIIIYICHIIASIAVCFIFRGPKLSVSSEKIHVISGRTSFAAAFTGSVKASLVTVGNICGFVIFFCVIIKVMELAGIIQLLTAVPARLLACIGADPTLADAIIYGIFELSTGVSAINPSGGLVPAMACAAFLLGWAGISVHFQALSLISGSGLSIKKYLTGKLLHAIIAAALTAAAGCIFLQSTPAFSIPGYQVVNYISLFFICVAAAVAVFMCFLLLASKAVKKHRGS